MLCSHVSQVQLKITASTGRLHVDMPKRPDKPDWRSWSDHVGELVPGGIALLVLLDADRPPDEIVQRIQCESVPMYFEVALSTFSIMVEFGTKLEFVVRSADEKQATRAAEQVMVIVLDVSITTPERILAAMESSLGHRSWPNSSVSQHCTIRSMHNTPQASLRRAIRVTCIL
jgi:hypothetical protein